jgi:ribosomal protein S12 methylthiotransferase accessory factor
VTLYFAPHLDVMPVAGRGLVTIGENGCDVHSGELFAQLGSLVDGARTEAEVVSAVEGSEPDAVTAALAQLKRAGVVIESVNGTHPGADGAWWSSQRIAPDQAARSLGNAAIRVESIGDLDPGPVVEALSAAEFTVSDDAELSIVLVADYLDKRLAERNERALSTGQRWILANPLGARILIGPAFWPDRGPCWACLAERLRHNRHLEWRLRWLAGNNGQRGPIEAPAMQHGLGPAMIATEAARWVAGARPGFESMVLAFDGRTWNASRHQVPWRPQCEACGAGEAPPEEGPGPVRIKQTASGEPAGRELRSVAPRQTLERFERHVSPLTGAIHMLHRAPGPEHLHAYMAGGPVARIHGDREGWENFSEQLSGGKGTTDQAARASAVCEALERYSGNFFGGEPRRRARLEELGESAIAPNEYMRYSERQFAQRERWNERSGSYRTFVPEPFDAEAEIDWSPVWSLTHDRERWLPTALLYYRAKVAGATYCVAESNGNAAGNTLEEAILHGLLELVERDHVALWWYNRIPAPAVELDSIADPWLDRLREQLAEEGREFWILDLTADLGLPAAAAIVASADGSGVGMGLGAQLDLRSASIRAATELAQLGLGSPSGGLGTGVDPALHLDEHPFIRPDAEVQASTCVGEPGYEGDPIAALDRCRTAIEDRGMELLVLDQTRPDIGLPVAKAIVPGMRHFWPRFGPGRLYDVPVALGRLSQARREDELNPTPPVP